MSRDLVLNGDHGTALLRALRSNVYPETVGEHKFTANERATFSKWMTKGWKTFRDHSPLFKKNSRLEYFGPEEWYDKVKIADEDARKRNLVGIEFDYALKEAKRDETITITVDDSVCKVLYLLGLTWLHPESKAQLNPALQDEFAWGFIRQLGGKTVAQMEKAIGLDQNKGYEVAMGDDTPDADDKSADKGAL